MKIMIAAMPLTVALLLGWMFWGSLYLGDMPSVQVGRELPEFELPALQGDETLTAETMPRQPYLLNIWASWCFPCRVEHPILMQLAQQGVVIVGLNYRDEPDSALQWLRDSGDPYTLNLVDSAGNLALDMGVTGVPETFLIDASGNIVHHRTGVLDQRVWEREFLPRLQELTP